jgi:hypothetical protein
VASLTSLTVCSIRYRRCGNRVLCGLRQRACAQTWDNCLNATADVKELIPEFFFQACACVCGCARSVSHRRWSKPEILRNTNALYLGHKQAGRLVDEVLLPPWARTADEFVRVNRAALESGAFEHAWTRCV